MKALILKELRELAPAAAHLKNGSQRGPISTPAGGNFPHVSTARGAFLEWLEGRTLHGFVALKLAGTSVRKETVA